ncbi:MAG: hypothetical protein NTY47_01680 [Candidatus Omnitrophica bacterium]|nr:hypothetical protein [Candidatus Omnitrophota bacterium]
MTNSLRENILANLATTLNTIKTTGGYNNTIASVQRWNQRGNPLEAVPCIVINSGPEEKKPEPNPQATCKFTVYLDVWYSQDDDETRSSDEILSSLLTDVEKAIMTDPTRGGYAEDTNILNNIPFETVQGQPSFGIILELEIIYKHKLTDPTAYV